MLIRVTEDNVLAGFANYASGLGQIGLKTGVDTLNTLGPEARREVIKAEVKATGLSMGLMGRAILARKASEREPVYTIFSAGGEISLRHFKAEETREGVTAKVLGETKVFAGTFMKAGSFSKGRITKPNWNRQVFRRTGGTTTSLRPAVANRKARQMDKFEVVRSGVIIPREMVKGEPLQAFETVSREFPGFVLRRLSEVQLQRQAKGELNFRSAGLR